jgi:hypothetical protein
VRFIGKKKVAAAVVALIVVGGAVSAYAYFTGGGSGSGSATAGDTQAVVVNQTGSITGLYPDAPAKALSGTFTNPNDAPVYVASVTASVADPAGTCAAADFVIGGTATVSAEVDDGSTWSGLTIAMVDDGTNQDDCKNVSITINYTANAA